MRNLVLATVSALALGIAGAGPLYAQGNTGTANPAPANPAATAPANPTAEPTTPQTGATNEATPGSMSTGSMSSSSNQYGTTPYMTHGAASSRHQGAARVTRSDIRQAQEKLRQDGFYHGKVDGIDGAKTRQAIRNYQRKNGLPVTARLDQNTLNELTGAGMGQGSSMPPGSATGMTPPASSAAGSSGSNNLNTPNYSGNSTTGK
jgi:peptidoglycan hydrolase-like protein with peptidoglycan-binding domain